MLLTKSPRITDSHNLERVDQILADATTQLRNEAYAAGWRDAIAAVRKTIADLVEPSMGSVRLTSDPTMVDEGGVLVSEDALLDTDPSRQPKPPRKGSIRDCVLQTVKERPGIRGTEIIEAVKRAGYNTTEGSVRITTFRLKEKGFIVARDRRWFPA